jgi:hypothetical protein
VIRIDIKEKKEMLKLKIVDRGYGKDEDGNEIKQSDRYVLTDGENSIDLDGLKDITIKDAGKIPFKVVTLKVLVDDILVEKKK